MSDLRLKIDRARWWLLREQPFYGQLAMGLVDMLSPSTPTACTDGTRIIWGEKFLANLTDEECRYILVHETLHCAHHHLWRLPPDVDGNKAGDFVIERILRAIPNTQMPKGGLVSPPEYADLAEEEIYGRLRHRPEPPPAPKEKPEDAPPEATEESEEESPPEPSQEEEQEQELDDCPPPDVDEPGDEPSDDEPSDEPGDEPGDDPGSGMSGDDGEEVADPCGGFGPPAEEEGESEGEDAPDDSLKDQWERRVIQAAQAAQVGRGTVPADMERVLAKVRHQPIDWKRELADFVKDALAQRNDWSRSARRHAWQRVIYPRKRTDDLALVVFARDTSGSIDGPLCEQFSACITDCLADTGCRGLVIDCDAEIQAEYPLAAGEECPLTAKGGGGTLFAPVMDRVRSLVEEGERVAGLVYLTDLDGDHGTDPDVPVLWLSTSDYRSVPYGRIVPIEN